MSSLPTGVSFANSEQYSYTTSWVKHYIVIVPPNSMGKYVLHKTDGSSVTLNHNILACNDVNVFRNGQLEELK